MDCIARFFEPISEAVFLEDYGTTQRSNKWRNIKDTRDKHSQTDMACKYFDSSEEWNYGK